MFWEDLSLVEMSPAQWESLCDGCARCCLHKLQDRETGAYAYTAVACELLDLSSCRCGDYANRSRRVPDCADLRLLMDGGEVSAFSWLPTTCAYRLLAEGQPLPDWHHLVSGDSEAVHREGYSVRGKVLSATDVHPDEIEECVIQWIDT